MSVLGIALRVADVATALLLAGSLFMSLLAGRYDASPACAVESRMLVWASGRVVVRPLARTTVLALSIMLVATAAGMWELWREAHGPVALFGTRYGRLMLLRASLLVPVLAHTGWTRCHLQPRPADEKTGAGRAAMRAVPRLVAVGEALGSGAILVVSGVLAITRPALHETPVWPFEFRLAPEVMWTLPGVKAQVVLGALIGLVGLLALVAARVWQGWRPLLLASAAVLLVIGLQRALPPLTVDAYPTTYTRPPVAYSAESVRQGHDLFAVHCVSCHGPAGRGDGPAAAGLIQRPADLTARHTADHTPGDLYWWITNGLGLGMPAFRDRLSPEDRWSLVNFVRALGPNREPVPSQAPR